MEFCNDISRKSEYLDDNPGWENWQDLLLLLFRSFPISHLCSKLLPLSLSHTYRCLEVRFSVDISST